MKHLSRARTGACWRVPLGREGVRRIPENQVHFHQIAWPGSCYGCLPSPITLWLARLRGAQWLLGQRMATAPSRKLVVSGRAAWSRLRSSLAADGACELDAGSRWGAGHRSDRQSRVYRGRSAQGLGTGRGIFSSCSHPSSQGFPKLSRPRSSSAFPGPFFLFLLK